MTDTDCTRPDCTLPARQGRRCPECRDTSERAILADDTTVADLLPSSTPAADAGTPATTGQQTLEVYSDGD